MLEGVRLAKTKKGVSLSNSQWNEFCDWETFGNARLANFYK